MGRCTDSERERFSKNIVENGACILWKGRTDKDGYGIFFFRRKNRRAHRVSYYINVGDIPRGLVIDHICGKRNCVAPSHLRAITVRENSLDGRGIGAINARKTHCKNGHAFDRVYGGQRYCSICDAEKKRRLTAKWRAEGDISC